MSFTSTNSRYPAEVASCGTPGPIRNPFGGPRTPSAFVMQECQPLAEEKEASLVIGHEKATSRA